MKNGWLVVEHTDGEIIGSRVFSGARAHQRAMDHVLDLAVEYANGDTVTGGQERQPYTKEEARAALVVHDGETSWTDPDDQYDVVLSKTKID
jgi:hypothetical protein